MNLSSLTIQLNSDDLKYIFNLPYITADDKIKELDIHIISSQLIISGKYPTKLFSIPFKTFWNINGDQNGLYFVLEKLEPANFLKTLLLEQISAPNIIVQDQTIMFDVRGYLKDKNIPIQFGTISIVCLDGYMSLMVFTPHE